jgi:peroxidase
MHRSKYPIALPGQTQAPKSSHRQRRPRTCRPQLEQLETRVVMDVRSITGVGNNLDHLAWGAAGTDLLRVSPVAYADGLSSPSTPNTLNPREISNELSNQSDPIFSFADNLGNANAQRLSDYSYAWGQFLDHDMSLTLDNSGQAFNIPASTTPGDPMGEEPFTRSQFVTDANGVRQQINAVTSYLDLSQVYGSTDFIANALRTHNDGLLKTSPGDFLPLNNTTYFTTAQISALNMANDAHQVLDSQLFAAGDRRANENVELTSLTTLFVRNHNRLATQLEALHPFWTDQQLYQEARKLNIAEMEIINYTGYLPSILGPNALPAYTGYTDDVNAGIATEFSTVGFRFGHSLLSTTVGRDNNNGTGITDVSPNGSTINLTEDFFRPDLLNNNHVTVSLVDRFGNPDPHTSSTVGEVLKGLADGLPNETDLRLIDEVRNILFGIPTGPGTDLGARDIQRARDHGIGTYNQVRVAYGLPPATSFAAISSDPDVQAALQATYGTVDQIDPFEGMLAEDHVPGADVGPTVKAILVKQFAALRDGDRFFYLNESFSTEERNLIAQGNTLAKVIKNNTSITNLQADVFFNRLSIEGTVFFDPNSTGHNTGTGVQGVTINLLDDTGAVIATTTTDVNGHYEFTEQAGIPATGNYTVQVVLPSGGTATTVTSHVVHLSRGDLDVDNEDFGMRFTI